MRDLEGFSRSAEARRERALARAERHSRRVRFLRRAIPLGAALAVGLILVLALYNPFAASGGLSLGPISVSGTRVVMEQPRLTGFQSDNRPYEVTADEASQDVRSPNLVDLKTLRARITLDEQGGVARLEADLGRFDTTSELLELNRHVRVTSNAGYSADLHSATVDFKAGSVISREPVRVGFGAATIDADNLDIVDNGKVIVFTGRVRSVFAPKPQDGEAEGAGAGTARAAALRSNGGDDAPDRPRP